MPRLPLLVLALGLAHVVGCATAPPPAPTADTAPRRRRARRPRPVEAPAPAPAASADAAPSDSPAPSTALGIALAPPASAPSAPPAPPASGATFGTPVVARDSVAPLRARWVTDDDRPRIVCEGEATAQVPSMQSPWQPSATMLARALGPLEAAVLACGPRADENGRFLVRAQFGGGGLPQEFSFPGLARLGANRARCLGAALCAARMPAFRAGSAVVNYEYVVAPPAP
jgi:hypothetical protein